MSSASCFPFSCCSQLSGCATAGLGNRAICVAPWPLGPIRAKVGLLSRPRGAGVLEAVLQKYFWAMTLASSGKQSNTGSENTYFNHSRSNPASITPAVLPPTHYLQLPAPASTSSGSQQLRLCDQGVCKPDKEVELLADLGLWLKKSTCATVSSFERVRAASQRAALSLHQYAFPYSRPTAFRALSLPLHFHISAPICTSPSRPIALTTVR